MTPALWRVRVLTRNREFAPYSSDITRDEALDLQQQTQLDAAACRDGGQFITFPRHTGLPVKIRGHDVVGVEIIPPLRPRQAAATDQPFVDEVAAPPAAPAGQLVALVDPAQQPAAAGPATQFLLTLPDRHPQVRPARRGGTR